MPENQGALWRDEGAKENEKAVEKLIFIGFYRICVEKINAQLTY